jgi:hypothetical protein
MTLGHHLLTSAVQIYLGQKRELDMKIDAILKPSKGKRKQSKKKGDEEVLDRFADEEVSRLRESMLNAAEEDEAANREKLPAVAKLRLLPQVMDVLRKSVSSLVPHLRVSHFDIRLLDLLLNNLSRTTTYSKVSRNGSTLYPISRCLR